LTCFGPFSLDKAIEKCALSARHQAHPLPEFGENAACSPIDRLFVGRAFAGVTSLVDDFVHPQDLPDDVGGLSLAVDEEGR
jgi:hypothetical protein